MTATIPNFEPFDFTAGETLIWTKTLSDYSPLDGWTLTYYFRSSGGGFDAPAVADGSDFKVTVTSANTANLAGGTYYWQGWVTNGAEKHLIAEGQTEVRAAFGAAGVPYDGRSLVKKILDAIDALIANKATKDQQEYQIGHGSGSRMLRTYSPGELIQLRTTYARLYALEQERARIQGKRPFFKNIYTTFTPEQGSTYPFWPWERRQ